jgi:Holliday junction resolvase RusA-like endonuclease
MSVRKRNWVTPKGEHKEAWVVDFADVAGRRRLKTFDTKKAADKFEVAIKAVRSGAVPEPMTKSYRPIEFVAPLAPNGKGIGREMIAKALRSAHPNLAPTTEVVVVHVVAEVQPSSVIADVDNLLKPVLDSLKGVAWVDDTQVCELLVRRTVGRKAQLRIKIWHMPGAELRGHINVLAETDFYGTPKEVIPY